MAGLLEMLLAAHMGRGVPMGMPGLPPAIPPELLESGAEPDAAWTARPPALASGAEPSGAWTGGITPPVQRGLPKDTGNPLMGMLASLMQRPTTPGLSGEPAENPGGGLLRPGALWGMFDKAGEQPAQPSQNAADYAGLSDAFGSNLPPSTNDPASGEPQVFANGVPLPRPKPIGAAGLPAEASEAQAAAPLSMAPPSDVSSARRQAPGAPAASGGGFGDIMGKVFNPANAPLLLALGSGLSGAPSFGTGMRRASAAAVAPAAMMQKDRETKENQRQTYEALVAKGVPPQEAVAAMRNPEILKAVVAKYFETKPLVPHEIGTDRFGNKIMGTFNPTTGKYSDTAGRPITGSSPALNTGQPQDGGGVSGAEFLKTLPDKAYADKIKAIAEGREPFPQGQIMRSPYGRKLGEDVLAYDPSFDAVNYKSRETTRKDFTAGKSAQNLTAFNTAIGHLESLDKSIAGLNNSGFKAWNNWVANPVAEQFSTKYQVGLKEFQAARTAVADELTRAFRGSGGNVHDIKAWEATINQADSPEALRSAIKQAAELLRSRIDAVGDQYNRGMGTTKDPLELLNPKAAAAFKRLHEQDPMRGPGGSAAGKTGTGIQWSIDR